MYVSLCLYTQAEFSGHKKMLAEWGNWQLGQECFIELFLRDKKQEFKSQH
jgi:hypothetical protein